MMKNILVLIGLILLVAFTGRSEAGTKSIIGELVNEGSSVALYTRDGRYSLETATPIQDCFEGEYTVRPSNKGEKTLELVEAIYCRGKGRGFDFGSAKSSDEIIEDTPRTKELIEDKYNRCPNVKSPVCGLLNGVPTTFPNICELERAGARKLFYGKCELPMVRGLSMHQENFRDHIEF